MASIQGNIIRISIFILLCLSFSTALAQNEVARERSSLKGIQSVGFTVNVEANVSLSDRGEIQVTSLKELGEQTLSDQGIRVIPDENIESSGQVPFLYMHINTMDAGSGLVPFCVALYFYQPVELSLNRNMQTSAITWESSTLGLVSYDKMHVIREASKNLLDEFITDFKRINDMQ